MAVIHDYGFSEFKYKNFIKPSILKAINELSIPGGARILDAGCGPGATIYPLLEKTNFTGHLFALDSSEPHLMLAEKHIERLQIKEKVTFLKNDLFNPFPFEDNFFDIVWFSDVLFPDDIGVNIDHIIKECRRVLKPNGTLAIFYGNWLRLQLLSGYSCLEHYISIANEMRKSQSQKWVYSLHPENASQWLLTNGFKNCMNTFHETVYALPLRKEIEEYLLWHLTNIYGKAIHFTNDHFKVPKEMISLWNRILDKDSADYLLSSPGYYCRVSALLTRATK